MTAELKLDALNFGLSDVALFIVIGVIVSLDVAGLTAVREETYFGSVRARARWAVRNGFWHAVLLLGYGLVAIGLIDLALPFSLEWLVRAIANLPVSDEVEQFLRACVVEFRDHFVVVFAFATIAVVWRAYHRKVIENPLVVDKREKMDAQRRLLKWLMERLGMAQATVRVQLQSIAVAMDMLALAFLLKSLNRFDGNPFRVVYISIIILVTVSAFTYCTSQYFRREFSSVLESGNDAAQKRKTLRQSLVLIRLIEPLLIFYFIMELMTYLIWGRMSSSIMLLAGSALLVFALVKIVSFAHIVDVVDNMVNKLLRRKRGDGR